MIEQKAFEKFIGAQFGQYRIERFVEETSHSPVFLAHAEGSTAKYFVRLLAEPAHLHSRNREEYLASVQYRISQIAALQHPYIMPIVDYGVFRGIPFLVTPQISMRSLRTRLDKNGAMDVITAGRYLVSRRKRVRLRCSGKMAATSGRRSQQRLRDVPGAGLSARPAPDA